MFRVISHVGFPPHIGFCMWAKQFSADLDLPINLHLKVIGYQNINTCYTFHINLCRPKKIWTIWWAFLSTSHLWIHFCLSKYIQWVFAVLCKNSLMSGNSIIVIQKKPWLHWLENEYKGIWNYKDKLFKYYNFESQNFFCHIISMSKGKFNANLSTKLGLIFSCSNIQCFSHFS